MPEAPVDEDNDTSPREYDVSATPVVWDGPAVHAKAQATAMKSRPNGKFARSLVSQLELHPFQNCGGRSWRRRWK
jgi:hypothetical protein